ncbi:MAG: hypothetical protein GDA36_12515, partial [Rhodobacteraceae bacterium]|nr:hypothetical protein [Paracoccaceae bacterium]
MRVNHQPMLLGGRSGWFDALVFRGSCRTRFGSAQTVLTGIDAPVDWLMDWRWRSSTRKRALGRAGIGPQGY